MAREKVWSSAEGIDGLRRRASEMWMKDVCHPDDAEVENPLAPGFN